MNYVSANIDDFRHQTTKAYSSVLTQERHHVVGVWTWVGLTSNRDATPPHSNALALH